MLGNKDRINRQIEYYFSQNKYISDNEYDQFVDLINNKITKISLKENKKRLLFNHNGDFLRQNLIDNRVYFNNMFTKIDPTIKLDDHQRKIILANEDSLLVMAGAGSGKTTTMAAKVKYLVDKCGYKESEILVVSYTNKAAKEIEDRIHKDFKLKGVTVQTFHKLGLNIIRRSNKPVVRIIKEYEQYQIISDYITKQLFKDKKKFESFYKAFSDKLFFDDRKEWQSFENFIDYHNYIYSKNQKNSNQDLEMYNEQQIKKRRQYLKTIQGEYVASREEVDIANFLFKNGIYYEYEKTFGKTISLNKSYKPDFYIRQLENVNYIEHFGIDENNFNASYTKEQLIVYLDNMKLKQQFFKLQPKDLFITTLSRYNNGTNYLNKLEKELLKRGYEFKKRNNQTIFTTLRDTNLDGYFARFISYYAIHMIKLLKNNSQKQIEVIKQKLSVSDNEKLTELLKIYDYYQNKLQENDLIDFEDMINLANELIPTMDEEDLGVNYNYIIIDEYQDISMQRFNLTKKLADLFEAKIMAVGDDWQSIFSFIGSDLTLFTNFKQFLPTAKKTLIPFTYRNSQELIDVAKNFITKNNLQFDKNLISYKHLKNPIEIHVYKDKIDKESDNNRIKEIEKIIGEIYHENPNHKILLLGRYNKDKDRLIVSGKFTDKYKNKKNTLLQSVKYPKAKLEFLTAHRSKGLGFDQVIIVDMADGKLGFPSKIEDEKLVKLLLDKQDEPIEFAEERRLFYVALTRTKNKTYILTPESKMSIFLLELEKEENVIIK